jgi:dihydrofolate reductase
VSARLVHVVAMTRGRVIGAKGGMPWRMSSDLKHFKAATWGKPMVMGRKTFEAIGRPLPGRESIVVTRDPAFAPPGVLIARDVPSALALAQKRADAMGAQEIAVIGGGEIFRETMDLADELIVTHLDLEPEGDTYYPGIDLTMWREASSVVHPQGPNDDAAFAVVRYLRR